MLRNEDKLVATARDLSRLADLTKRYSSAILAVPLDVTKPAAAPAAVEQAVSAFGRLDVVVNNAGYATLASIEDITTEELRKYRSSA